MKKWITVVAAVWFFLACTNLGSHNAKKVNPEDLEYGLPVDLQREVSPTRTTLRWEKDLTGKYVYAVYRNKILVKIVDGNLFEHATSKSDQYQVLSNTRGKTILHNLP